MTAYPPDPIPDPSSPYTGLPVLTVDEAVAELVRHGCPRHPAQVVVLGALRDGDGVVTHSGGRFRVAPDELTLDQDDGARLYADAGDGVDRELDPDGFDR